MHPILLKSGPFTVYSYGVMVAIGFALATLLMRNRAAKFGINKDKVVDLAIIILVFGILGARLFYVLLNISFYAANPVEIIMLSKGGLIWYGGFMSAIIALIIYARLNKFNFWSVVDLLTPYVALAQGFGRIGCFLNGCCYGIKVAPGFPFAVTFPGESDPRIPAQIVSAGLLFLIFIILVIWQNRRRFGGEISLGYCILYSSKRFVMEFLRGDNPKMLFGLTMSGLISLGVFIVSLTVFLYKVRRWNQRPTASK